jgi:putative transposase
MAAILLSFFGALGSALRTYGNLVLENLALRQQLAVFKRRHPRPHLTHPDRLFWIALSRVWSRWRETMVLVKPETVVGWHRWAFRRFWTWRSRRRQPGRPPTSREVRDLIKRMAAANVGWGAPRIHGELLKLGIVISEREVSRLMPPRPRRPPWQTWRTFLANHVGTLASGDFFTVPTATFRVLYVFFVLAHDRRRVLHFNVTENPSAEWTAQQIVEAFPEDTAPKYMIRDRDGIYGDHFRRRVQSLGIEEVLTAPRWLSKRHTPILGRPSSARIQRHHHVSARRRNFGEAQRSAATASTWTARTRPCPTPGCKTASPTSCTRTVRLRPTPSTAFASTPPKAVPR